MLEQQRFVFHLFAALELRTSEACLVVVQWVDGSLSHHSFITVTVARSVVVLWLQDVVRALCGLSF